MIGLFEESDRIAFKVIEARLAGMNVVHRRLSAVLPIMMFRTRTNMQADQKGIFPLY
jgi:hypothetical protein